MRWKNKLCVIILTILIVTFISQLKSKRDTKIVYDNKEIKETSNIKYFDTKYSIEDMYNLISKREIPDDNEFYDILLNWYDYYSEDNLFINSFGEEINKYEYQKIKNAFSDDTLKVLLVNVKKSWFLPVLD